MATLKEDLGPDYVQSLERGLAVLRCFSGTRPSLTQQLVLWIGFGTVCPVLFFRHSRGLWLGFDYIFDPGEAAEPKHRRGQD